MTPVSLSFGRRGGHGFQKPLGIWQDFFSFVWSGWFWRKRCWYYLIRLDLVDYGTGSLSTRVERGVWVAFLSIIIDRSFSRV